MKKEEMFLELFMSDDFSRSADYIEKNGHEEILERLDSKIVVLEQMKKRPGAGARLREINKAQNKLLDYREVLMVFIEVLHG